MSLYSRYVLPCVISKTCASRPVMKQRQKVVPLAEGRVLEIGAGGGLNLGFYDAAKVRAVIGLDASPELLDTAARTAAGTGLAYEPLLSDAADVPVETGTIDTVLVTYTLCSIDALDAALREMHRVLRPDGRLVFCEHGLAPDAGVARWQHRLTPLWKRVGGGCRLDRDPVEALSRAGFRVETVDHMYLPGTPRFAGYNSWGVALPG